MQFLSPNGIRFRADLDLLAIKNFYSPFCPHGSDLSNRPRQNQICPNIFIAPHGQYPSPICFPHKQGNFGYRSFAKGIYHFSTMMDYPRMLLVFSRQVARNVN